MAGNANYQEGVIRPLRPVPRASSDDKRCRLCDKFTGFILTCKLCDSPWHPLCAFFKGLQL
jgi:hypothetical protein